MKILIYILTFLALALLVFNITKLDFNNLLEGDSKVAVICIIAAACVILLMIILGVSRKIAKKN